MFRTGIGIALLVAVGCGDNSWAGPPPSSMPADGPWDDVAPVTAHDATPSADATVARSDAAVQPPHHVQPTCTAVVLSTTTSVVNAGWTVACPAGGQALAIIQVGSGATFGEWDSRLTDCGGSDSIALGIAPASGPTAWATVDVVEWPYDMNSVIGHCGTPGSP